MIFAPAQFDGGVAGCDPHGSSVLLLMHMNGANGSTTFTDVAGHVPTVQGDAQIKTDQFKFGGASAYFDGSVDCLLFGPDALYGVPGDFTLEAFIRIETLRSCVVFAGMFSSGATWRNNYAIGINASGYLYFIGYGTSTIETIATSSVAMSAGNWYHIAVRRTGTSIALFIDGAQVASAVYTTPIDSYAFCVGRPYPGAGLEFSGWIDELRLTKGVSRDIEVPLAPYPDNWCT